MARRERTILTAERDADAARMRAKGATYRQIAAEFHVAPSAAYKAVQRAIASAPREAAEELIALELARLDSLDREAWAVLERFHYVVSDGRIVKTEDGAPLRDSKPILDAINVLRRNGESRRKLLGLDAPTRHEVLTLDAIDAEIARLSGELGRNETGAAPRTAGAARRV